LGKTNDLEAILSSEKVDEVVIAMPSASRQLKKQIVTDCENAEVKCRTIPGIYEIIDEHVGITQIRDVDVEDILGREPVKMKLNEISTYLSDKPVLVTGAGGSIGSELCRQVAMVRPSCLILVDQSENDLFNIDRRLRVADSSLNVVPIIENITNVSEVNKIFERYKPEVIFHAAAYKHVPMLELNLEVALLNNFVGTKIVAEAALKYDAKKFILVSTDKAIEPKNVMGVSKALAELEIQSLSDKDSTSFIIVRFGNVLGSSGSVVPIFKEQITKGGPVTVTHPQMQRYFMTIPEAVQLVIQAGAMGNGGEIFVLDMGKQVKIKDLAENMIRLSGFEPGQDIPIEYVGIRPGEKLKEKLFGPDEEKTTTSHEKIFLAQKRSIDRSELKKALLQVEELIEEGKVDQALERARDLIPGCTIEK
jgi:FlaA1/EpsC-like NDP-sugar epimerase